LVLKFFHGVQYSLLHENIQMNVLGNVCAPISANVLKEIKSCEAKLNEHFRIVPDRLDIKVISYRTRKRAKIHARANHEEKPVDLNWFSNLFSRFMMHIVNNFGFKKKWKIAIRKMALMRGFFIH
jgi:hypothetical protein